MSGYDRLMKKSLIVTGRQIAAARVLVGLGKADLAAAASLSLSVLRRIETSAGLPAGLEAETRALCLALEQAGAEFIGENGGGPGVRLRFSRREVRAIDTLENEGGPVAEDDV